MKSKSHVSFYYGANDNLDYTPLTPEREAALFSIYYTSEEPETSLAARDEIIKCHLKLVVKLALQTARGMMPEDEAISAGNAGLMQALECRKFKPDNADGTRFSSYIRLFIRGQVLKVLSDCQQPPVSGELKNHSSDACITGTDASRVDSYQSSNLCTPFATHGKAGKVMMTGCIHLNTIPADDSAPDGNDEAVANDKLKVLEEALSKLTEVEAFAVREHHFNGRNFQEAGDLHKPKMGREGIRKAHDRGIAKLKEILGPRMSELV